MTEAIRSFACCSSMVCISAFPHGQDVDIDVRRHDAFWIERSHRHDLINLCNDCVCRHGHDGVEVPSGLVVNEVAEFVRLVRPDECNICMDSRFEDAHATIELLRFLVGGQFRPHSRRGVETVSYTHLTLPTNREV